MVRRLLLPLALAVVALTLQAFSSPDALATAGSCAFCQDMEGGGGWGHSCQEPGAQFETCPHVAWRGGICSSEHSNCNPEEAENLQAVVAADNDDRLLEIIATNPAQIQVNWERRAVQVADCTGRIIAHYPVGETLFGRLAGSLR